MTTAGAAVFTTGANDSVICACELGTVCASCAAAGALTVTATMIATARSVLTGRDPFTREDRPCRSRLRVASQAREDGDWCANCLWIVCLWIVPAGGSWRRCPREAPARGGPVFLASAGRMRTAPQTFFRRGARPQHAPGLCGRGILSDDGWRHQKIVIGTKDAGVLAFTGLPRHGADGHILATLCQ